MENQIITEEEQVKLSKFKNTSFELVRSKKSGFLKDETGVNGIPPIYLSSSKTHFLLMVSRLYLGKGKGYMPTQYVIGAPTHYVNDYYEDANGELVLESLFISAAEAKDKGYQFRPGLLTLYGGKDNLRKELVNANKLGICFDQGKMEIAKYGDDPVLLKFVNEHEQNDSAPRAADNKDPKRSKLFQFQPLMKEQKAAKSRPVANFHADFAAMEFVGKLCTKKKDGYEYDQDTLNAVLYVLGEGKDLGLEDYNQKFELVVKAVKADGATFMELVNGAFDEYKMDIAQAEKLKVLNFGAKEVKMTEGGKETTIYTFKKGNNKAANTEELAVFFLSPAGDVVYTEMIRLSEIAKIGVLATK